MDNSVRKQIQRDLPAVLDRGTIEEVADFSASRLAWALEEIERLETENERLRSGLAA